MEHALLSVTGAGFAVLALLALFSPLPVPPRPLREGDPPGQVARLSDKFEGSVRCTGGRAPECVPLRRKTRMFPLTNRSTSLVER